jgi:hypothetical protein
MLACRNQNHLHARLRQRKCGVRCSKNTYAEFVNVGIVADPCEILPDALAERHVLDVGVLVAKVMRATDVKARQGRETAQDSQTRRRLTLACQPSYCEKRSRANFTSEVSVCSQPPSSLSSTTFSLEVTQGGMTCNA